MQQLLSFDPAFTSDIYSSLTSYLMSLPCTYKKFKATN